MDVQGKIAIVTGSNTGIGRVTAETLARKGARVFLANRSEEKTKPVIDAIAAAGGKADFLSLDLADLDRVRASAEAFLALDLPLHLLINNAGLAGVRGHTKQGFEITFGTNHIGPYLFTRLLLPALERAAKESGEARIVNVSSKSHYQAKTIDFDHVRGNTSVAGLPEYAQSKLANVLFAKELARRVPKEIRTYSLHPGVVASDVWREVPWGVRHLMKLFMISNEEGAQTTLHCALSDEAKNETGLYYDKSKARKPNKVADDESLARTLWTKSAEWVSLPA
jgi:NAD(P)-dependent dehydrogenase (short-subunit alcohol dehydrogenase family)